MAYNDDETQTCLKNSFLDKLYGMLMDSSSIIRGNSFRVESNLVDITSEGGKELREKYLERYFKNSHNFEAKWTEIAESNHKYDKIPEIRTTAFADRMQKMYTLEEGDKSNSYIDLPVLEDVKIPKIWTERFKNRHKEFSNEDKAGGFIR